MYASRKKVFNLNFSTWRVAFADGVLGVVRLLRCLCPLTLTYICRNVGCVSVEQEETTHMQIDYTLNSHAHKDSHTQLGHAQLTLTLFLRIIMWFPSGIRTCVCPVSMCVCWSHAHCLGLSASKHLGEAQEQRLSATVTFSLSAWTTICSISRRAEGRHMSPGNPFGLGRGAGG